MSVYSKHKATALDFMKFYESDTIQRRLLINESNAPDAQEPLHATRQLLARPEAGLPQDPR